MEFKLTRICKDCNNVDTFKLSKKEAAFELYDSKAITNMPCSSCGSLNCDHLGRYHSKIDKELLDIWGQDINLYFLEQDEEIYLADDEYFNLLLEAIDNSKYLKSKIDILTEAICVLLYDYTANKEEYSNKENEERENIASKIRPELIKRKEKIKDSQNVIMDYIKKVVFPQIGLN